MSSLQSLPSFLLVGTALAATNLAFLWFAVEQRGWPVLWACTVSFFLLNFVGYALNKILSFRRGTRLVGAEMLRYYGIMAVSLAANLLLMAVLVNWLSLHYLLASIGVTFGLALLNYAGHYRYTFRRP